MRLFFSYFVFNSTHPHFVCSTSSHSSSSNVGGRKKYSFEDMAALCQFVLDEMTESETVVEVFGNELWRKAEARGVLEGRSYQSMRDK